MSNLTRTTGILNRLKGGMVLMNPITPIQGQVQVPARLAQQYALVEGATVSGLIKPGRQGGELTTVETVCGLTPEAYRARPRFGDLTVVDPSERFDLGGAGEPAMRAVDLLAPIGKGTRGLIVAPPKAGKTTLLEQIARAIRVQKPDARIVVLLIDERPEELTYFRRTVSAEVFASSIDQAPAEHTALNELMLAHIRTELECGNEVVVLLDSLTRLTRAYNNRSTGRRTLSGGIDATAMEIPRRFLGLARNIEHGGSVTILATVLIDTGSRQDQLIYEEFKSTGNCEIVLNRELAQARLFPAIDVQRSGTRKEEAGSTDAKEMAGIIALRRMVGRLPPFEAMSQVMRLIEQYETNEELLRGIVKR